MKTVTTYFYCDDCGSFYSVKCDGCPTKSREFIEKSHYDRLKMRLDMLEEAIKKDLGKTPAKDIPNITQVLTMGK